MSYDPRSRQRQKKSKQTPRDEQQDGAVDDPSIYARLPWRLAQTEAARIWPIRTTDAEAYQSAELRCQRSPKPADDDDNSSSTPADDLESFELGSQDGISVSSDFSLILENDDLDRAKARMSELRRAELEVQFPHDGKRTRNSKMAKFQRAVAFSNWRQLQGQAPEYLSDQRLADWGNWTTANATGHRHAGQRRE